LSFVFRYTLGITTTTATVLAKQQQSQKHDRLQNIDACVPHLGAHLAELVTILEGNSNFLPHLPHIINMDKYRLLSRTLGQIYQMQQLRYRTVNIDVLM
jgi:hypothetical protein